MSASQTVAIFAWHINDISGTGVVLRNLLHFLQPLPQLKFIIVLPETPKLITAKQVAKFPSRVVEKKKLSQEKWLEKAEVLVAGKAALAFHLNNVVPVRPRLPFVALIHDVLPLSLPEYRHNPFKLWKEKRLLSRASKAALIATVSDFSKKEICRSLKLPEEKVMRIYNGTELNFEKMPFASRAARKNILYVGDLRRRKNVIALVKAYLLLPESLQQAHKLLLTGEGKEKKRFSALFRKARKEERLEFLGKLKPEKVVRLYDAAFVFVFPSLMEGFGLPVLEAARRKTPVICGYNSSLPEVVKDTALKCDVSSPQEIAAAIVKVWQDASLRNRLSEKGYENSLSFSFSKAARRYQEIFMQLLRQK